MSKNIFTYSQPFPLESGETLPAFELAYTTFGSLQRDERGIAQNVVWICHALTANAHPEEWWEGLFGKGKLYDPEQYFIVCVNMLGSCYGSSNALSTNPSSQEPYYYDFPELSIRDIVRAQILLRKELQIEQILICTGGSMGGQQALEWAILEESLIQNLIILASNAQHSPWGIAFNESQRLAIQADPTWGEKRPDAGKVGLKAARSIALLSYRNYEAYQKTQAETSHQVLNNFKAASYQQYQGDKLVKRFHSFSYWTLSKAMDSHNVGRDRGEIPEVLRRIQSNTLIIGIQSDILFPPEEQKYLQAHIPEAALEIINSPYGHDGFLIEFTKIHSIIKKWLKN